MNFISGGSQCTGFPVSALGGIYSINKIQANFKRDNMLILDDMGLTRGSPIPYSCL